MSVFRFVFCNVCLCVGVGGFVMSGCVYVCVGFVMCKSVCMCGFYKCICL